MCKDTFGRRAINWRGAQQQEEARDGVSGLGYYKRGLLIPATPVK